MSDWLFSKNGQAEILLDGDCFRSDRGDVVAWIREPHVYSLNGNHIGWFENGVLYDSNNQALGFLRGATGSVPGRPGLGGTPGKPGSGGRPGKPGFGGVPGKPGRGGWSGIDLGDYFSQAQY